MLLGIYGGSFDPVHNGHLAMARACQEQAALDEVWFTPTAIQPLKTGGPKASNEHRVAMLNLAIESSGRGGVSKPVAPSWRVCTMEIDRGGISYSVDTVRQLYEELPAAKLYFMIGADASRDIPRWKETEAIFRLATPLILTRAGEPVPDLAEIVPLCTAETRPRLVTMPPVDVSSSDIRRRVAAGEPIDDAVPKLVAEYIRLHGLYR
jgi:nicotinate-nucleotide adenylyltransferase